MRAMVKWLWTEPDYAAWGYYILKGVELPLVEGESAEDLGRVSTISLYSALQGGTLKKNTASRAQHRKNLVKYAKGVALVQKLRDFLVVWHKHERASIELLETLHSRLAAICKIADEAAQAPSSAGELAYDSLVESYRRFFGVKPTFTYSEIEGHVGPFWNFARALRDVTGLEFSEEAIRKVHTRRNQKKQRGGVS
jgi:hypothetical protein